MPHHSFIKAYLALTLLFVASHTIAGPVDVKSAKNRAESFFNANLGNTSTGGKRSKARAHVSLTLLSEAMPETRSADHSPEYYIFMPEDSIGFVIVAGEDEVEPILGYSLNTKISLQQIPDAMKKHLESYRNYIGKIRSRELTPQQYTDTDITPVEPFITTKWNQRGPYNYYTPEIDGKQTLAGCVAVAVAQIMKYYEWPQMGRGTCTATLNDGNNTETTVTLGKKYSWANMMENASDYYTSKQKYATAALIRDVGYACKSFYGTDVTEAFTVNALTALLRHFYYSTDIKLIDKSHYSNDVWNEIMHKELLEGRPIWFCGNDEFGSGGHAYICCGIDQKGRYYINWGWGGYCDGYFYMGNFSPDGYRYNEDIFAIINIKPTEEGEYEENLKPIPHISEILITEQENTLSNPWLMYEIYYTNINDKDISGKIGISIWDSEATETPKIIKDCGNETIVHDESAGAGDYLYLKGTEFQTKGIRELRFLWQPDGSDEWYNLYGANSIIYMETTDTGHYFYTERPKNLPNNISGSIAEEFKLKPLKGAIAVSSPKEMTVRIYSTNGMMLRNVCLMPDTTQIIHLPQGIYIVNGQSVIVQ